MVSGLLTPKCQWPNSVQHEGTATLPSGTDLIRPNAGSQQLSLDSQRIDSSRCGAAMSRIPAGMPSAEAFGHRSE